MAFWNKKKNPTSTQTTEQAASAIVNTTMENAENQAQAQRALSEACNTIDAFNSKYELHLLSNPDLDDEFRKVALKNEAAKESIEAALTAAKDNSSLNPNQKQTVKEMEQRASLYNSFGVSKGESEDYIYDSIYFLPEDKDPYINAIRKIGRAFSEKKSSHAVNSGADYFFRNGLDIYIDHLEDAMRSGRKLKANTCLDVFRYILEVAYQRPIAFDDSKLQEVQENRAIVVLETAKSLVESIDDYYKELEMLANDDKDYKDIKLKWTDKRHEMEIIPENLRDQLLNMDLQNALQNIAETDMVKQYYNIVFEGKTTLTQAYLKGYMIQGRLVGLSDRRSGIIELLSECRQAFINRGPAFDQDQYIKKLVTIRNRNIEHAKEQFQWAIQMQNMNKATESLLKEAQTNPELGQAIANSTNSIYHQMELDKQNERMLAEIQKREAELKRKQAQQVIKATEEIPNEENRELLENDIDV